MAYGGWQQYRAEHLEQMLQAGEHILWQGKPVKAKYVIRGWPMSCFGVFFLGFALFWTVTAFFGTRSIPAEGDPMSLLFRYAFPAFGLPFIFVGSGLTFGHFIVAAAVWRNTEYALTNRRVLIRSGARTVTVTTTELADVTGLTVTGGAVGSLAFNTPGTVAMPQIVRGLAGRPGCPSTMVAATFECIPQPQDVHRIAGDALQRLGREKG